MKGHFAVKQICSRQIHGIFIPQAWQTLSTAITLQFHGKKYVGAPTVIHNGKPFFPNDKRVITRVSETLANVYSIVTDYCHSKEFDRQKCTGIQGTCSTMLRVDGQRNANAKFQLLNSLRTVFGLEWWTGFACRLYDNEVSFRFTSYFVFLNGDGNPDTLVNLTLYSGGQRFI